jgi:uncharacterized protein
MAKLQPEMLEKIMAYWSYWSTPLTQAVARRVLLPKVLDPQLVLVIQGVRRCGKSTLLAQLLSHYGLGAEHTVFLNFEDPRLLPFLDTDLLFQVVERFESLRENAPQLTFFFDEIQNVPKWETFLHTVLERPRHLFVVTGSNASLLSGELSTKLTGRHRLVELFPFDYEEATSAASEMTVDRYLTQGGFPKVVLSAGDLALRQSYFRNIVERDVTNRVGARSSGPVLGVMQMVMDSCGSELSLRRIAAANGLSPDTVGSYLRAAEDAYLLFSCPYYSHSSRKRVVRNKKYFPVDPGLRQAVVSSSSPNLRTALESVVYLTLRQRYGRVFYWRDRGEVDFVVIVEGKPLPIQVTWDAPHQRHYQALDEFYEAHPAAHEAVFLNRKDLEDDFRRMP